MIYEPLVAKGYEWVNACDEKDYERFFAFDGSPFGVTWKPVEVRRVRADETQECKLSDFPWLGGHAFVMRQKAVDQLRDMWDANGEILPLETDDGVQLYVFNSQVVDALDEAKSTIIRFPGSNRIMRVKKLALVENIIEGIDVFRLPHRASTTLVNENFLERYRKAGLVGLEFKKIVV